MIPKPQRVTILLPGGEVITARAAIRRANKVKREAAKQQVRVEKVSRSL
jgi:hypothetical protein